MFSKKVESQDWVYDLLKDQEILNGVVQVNPHAAKSLLRANFPNNRAISPSVVAKYAKMMKEGKWQVGLPLIFSAFERGERLLLDGQHRLRAVVESRCEIDFSYLIDIPVESVHTMDRGRRRTSTDLCHFDGISEARDTHTAAARCLLIPRYRYIPSKLEADFIRDLTKLHFPALNFAYRHLGKKTIAPVHAVVARAWYSENRQRLYEFCECLRYNKVIQGVEDNAALALANKLRQQKGEPNGETFNATRLKLHDLAQSALFLFLKKESRLNLVPRKNDPFPVPGLSMNSSYDPIVDREVLYNHFRERNPRFSIEDIGTV